MGDRSILVTGGGGYLGTCLIPHLLDLGCRVHLVDLFYFGQEPIGGFKDHPLFSFETGSSRVSPEKLEKFDAVIHLAGLSNDSACDLDVNWSLTNNYLSTAALIEASKTAGVKRFIFASSCSVYGAAGNSSLPESAPTNPTSLYSTMKLASERKLSQLASTDFRVTRLRLSTLFGLSPRMRFDLVVNAMTMQALKKGSIHIHGDGSQYRPLIHVQDAAGAIVTVLKSPQSTADTVYNLGHHSLNLTVSELSVEIARHFKGIEIVRDSTRSDARSYRPDFSRLAAAMQWQPRKGIADAVHEIRQAYEKGHLGTMENEKYYTASALKRFRPQVSPTPENFPAWAEGFLSAS